MKKKVLNVEKLVQIRKDMQLTTRSFANRLGKTNAMYWHWVSKKAQPESRVFEAIVRLHNEGYTIGNFVTKPIKQISIDDLYTMEDPNKSS